MPSQLTNKRSDWFQIALYFTFLGVTVLFLLKPLYDNDFYWHLKTGEWIWNNSRLPVHDLFNYTTPVLDSAITKFTLTSYWLSQLVLYLAFLAAGMDGIVILRFMLFALLVVPVIMRQTGNRTINSSLLILFSILICNFFYLERPQTFSFIYFGMLIYFLEKLKQETHQSISKNPSAYLLFFSPAITMLLWANSHGGYLIGQITLVIFIFMESIKFLHQKLRPLHTEIYVKLLFAGTVGIIFSLLNPNRLQSLLIILQQTGADDPSTHIQEYSSMLEFFSTNHSHVILIYVFIIILTGILVLLAPGKRDVTEIVLLTFLAYISIKHVRYAAFFPIAALPLIGRFLSSGPLLHITKILIAPLSICLAIYALSGEFSTNIAVAKNRKWISDQIFPEKAADFIISNNLSGNMYNDYDWGGYLIWRLAPDRKVFADGRNLNKEALALDYQIQTAYTTSTGEQIWKQVLDKYGVNYVVTLSRFPNGLVTPITNALLSDKDWKPVFLHRRSKSIIFVRNTTENYRIIAQSNFGGV